MTRKHEPGSQLLGNEPAQRAMTREHKINIVLEAWAPPPEQRDKCRRDLEEEFDRAEAAQRKVVQREAAQREAAQRNAARRKADRDKQINDALERILGRRSSARVAPQLPACSGQQPALLLPLRGAAGLVCGQPCTRH
jgi:hypothetical protein